MFRRVSRKGAAIPHIVFFPLFFGQMCFYFESATTKRRENATHACCTLSGTGGKNARASDRAPRRGSGSPGILGVEPRWLPSAKRREQGSLRAANACKQTKKKEPHGRVFAEWKPLFLHNVVFIFASVYKKSFPFDICVFSVFFVHKGKKKNKTLMHKPR